MIQFLEIEELSPETDSIFFAIMNTKNKGYRRITKE